MTVLDDLRKAALAVDLAYSRELRRVYGKGAGDARYLRKHADPDVQRAADEKLAADKAWQSAVRAQNEAKSKIILIMRN